ncbi:acyl-CoA carboxylase epsilon subunit [Streptomyces sp. NBC_01264]|uniref:acyl-CoA carboxylase epsilon subunit n=1 Tax=Streptomyces sp. NBC_01264 TaxID=2903804 RepID=UPI002253B6B6|nr:acyl-CoA carboxylase epsilon subunit [Streptomyces sp. NBC_01264]MCX4775765.1 acyl-CoA carboxylase epsilon subunit [Streptomyces sp. NBC_01264]
MLKDAPIAPMVPMTSLIRVEKGVAAPEELAAIAVVVACFARRNSAGAGTAPARAARRPAPAHHGSGCWAGCWACG